MKSKTKFTIIFVAIVLLDLVVGSMGIAFYRQFTKPLILISLLIYFAVNGKRLPKPTYFLTLGALFFSLLGDIFLMYDTGDALFFMLGLGSFFTAHVFYILAFWRQRGSGNTNTFLGVAAILLVYGTFIFAHLKPHLGDLVIPVIFYLLAILLLALSAFKRKNHVSNESFRLVFIGSLFFIASDSILAINKFVTAIPFSIILVMGTYALAQWFITMGMLESEL